MALNRISLFFLAYLVLGFTPLIRAGIAADGNEKDFAQGGFHPGGLGDPIIKRTDPIEGMPHFGGEATSIPTPSHITRKHMAPLHHVQCSAPQSHWEVSHAFRDLFHWASPLAESGHKPNPPHAKKLLTNCKALNELSEIKPPMNSKKLEKIVEGIENCEFNFPTAKLSAEAKFRIEDELYFYLVDSPTYWKYVHAGRPKGFFTQNVLSENRNQTTSDTLKRAYDPRRKYPLYLCQNIFEKNHLPSDLCFTAQVESHWKCDALNASSAEGCWQFITSTAKDVGLKHRTRLIESTHKAGEYLHALKTEIDDYLTKHHRHTDDDWLLALAAYNSGDGYVIGELSSQKSQTYWDTKLVQETMEYVPRILAVSIVGKNPKLFGFDIRPDGVVSHYPRPRKPEQTAELP